MTMRSKKPMIYSWAILSLTASKQGIIFGTRKSSRVVIRFSASVLCLTELDQYTSPTSMVSKYEPCLGIRQTSLRIIS